MAFFVLIVFSVVFIIVLKSPGNEFRTRITIPNASAHNLFWSLKVSLVYSFRSLIQSLWMIFLIPVSLLFFEGGIKLIRNTKIQQMSLFNVHPLLSLVFSFIIIFVGFFPGFWAQGVVLPDRSINLIFFHFLLGWSYFILTLCCYLHTHREAVYKSIPLWSYVLSGALVIFLIFTKNNLTTTYTDLSSGKMQRFNREQMLRYQMIDACNQSMCEIKKLTIHPTTIYYKDFLEIHTTWSIGVFQLILKKNLYGG